MSYLVLARKYRPRTFDEVVGQEGIVRILCNAIRLDRVAHAYLFCGARGVGKTTVARLLAKSLNCTRSDTPTPDPDNQCPSCVEIGKSVSPDVFEIDGASSTGVDDVRQLRDNIQYLPARSRYKIYIIDEVHMLSVNAFNALLKTLEEPPRHAKFIFATTEAHKIPLTVLSRCQRLDFKRIPSDVIFQKLKGILASENMLIEDDGLRAIAREAAGGMRDALSLTDQVLSYGGSDISCAQVFEALGLTSSTLYEEVLGAVLSNRPDELMQQVERLFEEGHDLKRFLEGLLMHVRHLILFRSLKLDPGLLVDVLAEERDRLKALAAQADAVRWHQIFDVLSQALQELTRSAAPRLAIETALLRVAAIDTFASLDELILRVEQLGQKAPSTAPLQPGFGTSGVRSAPPPYRPTPPPAPAPAAPRQECVEVPAKALPLCACPDSPPPEGLPVDWPKLVALVGKKRPSLAVLLTHACPRQVDPGKVHITLEPGSFYAEQLKGSNNIKDMERFCTEFFGQPTSFTLEERTDSGGVNLAKSAARVEQETEKLMQTNALAHPMVKEAIRIFSAEVEQIQPGKGEPS